MKLIKHIPKFNSRTTVKILSNGKILSWMAHSH